MPLRSEYCVAEVNQPDTRFFNVPQCVGRFHVAMNNIKPMQFAECLAEACSIAQHLLKRRTAIVSCVADYTASDKREAATQLSPAHQLHKVA